MSFLQDRELEFDKLTLDSISFYFDHYKIIELNPIGDTDEIEIKLISLPDKNKDRNIPIEEMPPNDNWFKTFINQKIQYIGLCTNNQGYQDQVIFAFGYCTPSVDFVSENSVLKVF
jgi:hypothetical protein